MKPDAGPFGLFDGPAPRVVTIAPGARFLDVLAAALCEALPIADDPFALADAVVLTPNRRAGRALSEALAQVLGGAALLPAIRPLADLDDDPDVWGPEPLAFAIPPAIDPLARRLELAALIRAREGVGTGADDPVRALALAEELCRLMDGAAAAEQVDWSRLPSLVQERELAAHWAQSAAFLEIVQTYWPQRLAADGLLDPATRRNQVLLALADRWTTTPPAGPLIIAGSTGSVAATRALMAVVAGLPRGVVVVPGLDPDIDTPAWEAISPHHPQYGLKVTLTALGLDRHAVRSLGTQANADRRHLIAEALAPAERTADWLARLNDAGGAARVASGAVGLRLIEAATEDEEATAIALLLREVKATPGKTAALVTPSGALVQRVAAKLARFGIVPQTSVGTPLAETEIGALILTLGELCADPANPAGLHAAVASPLVNLDAAALVRDVLRGPRRWGRLEQLVDLAPPSAKPAATALVTALGPLTALHTGPETDLGAAATALALSLEALCAPESPWQGPAGAVAAEVLRGLVQEGAALGPVRLEALPRLMRRLLVGAEVPPPTGGDPMVALLGPLEARLLRPDRVILGDLNEGAWPAPPPEDMFVSRSLRQSLGLPPPEVRIGLAAHDFAQLCQAPEVIMTRAARRAGGPSVASRWVWRVLTLCRGALGEDALQPDPAADPRAWARALDAPTRFAPAPPPRPTPPPEARPTSFSVTAVETLIRDPYAVYARRVLGLKVLDPVGKQPGPAERGTALHASLAIHLVDTVPTPDALTEAWITALAAAGFGPAQLAGERVRLRPCAEALIAWHQAQLDAGITPHVEITGRLDLKRGGQVHGRADRLDRRRDGTVEIIDFKSGDPPSLSQVASGMSPQLLLEAAIATAGGFEGLAPLDPAALVYWKIGLKPERLALKLPKEVRVAAAEAIAALEQLLVEYANPDQPYLCKPRPKLLKPYDEYDHLARRKEWADQDGAEGGG